MKKRFFLLTAMAAVLFSGCQQQDDFRGSQNESFDIKQMIITAGIEQEKSTRTSTVSDGTGVNILWSDDDSLSVLLNGMQMQTLFTIHTIDEDGLTATFVGNQVVVLGGTTDEDIQTAANVAIYPYTQSPITDCTYNAETGEHSFCMQYPDVQQYAAGGSVGNRAFPMVAVSKSYEHYGFGFRPVGSSIIIGLKGAEGTKIKNITLSSSKQKIAGKATVTASNAGTPTIAIDQTEGVNSITLDCGEDGVALNPETITQFTVTLPPITVAENELTFTICDTEGGSMEYVYEPAFTFVRNTHYTMNKIGTYEATTTTYPVYIGETGYATLAEAVAAAGEGEIITLQDDYESAADTEIKIGTGKSIILDLNEKTLSSTNSVKATHTNFININGGKLEVKNGRVEVKWTGENMGWNGGSNIFNVTAGGELVMNNVVTEHLGGTDMNFAVHLNNWGEVTLTADSCQFLATYCGVRAFNSGYDNNNIKITNSKLTGKTRAFWVHNYFGDFTDARHTEEAVIARLKIDIYNNNNTFEITGEAKSPIRYGYSSPVYFDETGKKVWPVENFTFDEDTKTYTVLTPTGLSEALSAAGAAGSGNSTIEISGDLNMEGVEWTPIKVDGYNGADIVTVEGNGATITNLSAPLFEGGFAGGSGIVIQNLTIADSKIVVTNTQGGGSFINCADSMDKITLINCHAKNVTLITPNDGADESRLGGLIGWTAGYNNQNDGPVDSYITVKNCSVKDCDIKCAGSVGGIIGHSGANAATFTTIENCTVTGNTLTSTDDGGWRVGVVVGTANNGQTTITGITESGNTVAQTGKTAPEGEKRNYFGRFVPAGTGSLTIDGAWYVTSATELLNGLGKDVENIKLIGDVALAGESIEIAAGKTVVLDLNGQTISQTGSTPVSMITNNGNLTISDSNGSGKIEFTFNGEVNNNIAANAISNRGTLVVEGGVISNTGTGNQIGYAIDNYNGATLTVKGGTISASGSSYYDGIRLFCGNKQTTVTVEDGTISTIWAQNPSANKATEVYGTVIVDGGTINTIYYENYTTVKVKTGVSTTVSAYGAGNENATTATDGDYTVYSFNQ